MEITDSMLRRFMGKVRVDARTGHWVWVGARNRQGYGRFCPVNGWGTGAHRFALMAVGIDLSGNDVHHLCHSPACVNPCHLEPLPPSAHRKLTRSGRAVLEPLQRDVGRLLEFPHRS